MEHNLSILQETLYWKLRIIEAISNMVGVTGENSKILGHLYLNIRRYMTKIFWYYSEKHAKVIQNMLKIMKNAKFEKIMKIMKNMPSGISE